MQAAVEAGPSSHHTLAINHRSLPGLIKAVNAVFSQAQHPFIFDEIVFQPAQASNISDRELLSFDKREQSPFILWFFNRPSQLTEMRGKNPDRLKTIPKTLAREIIASEVAAEITRLLNLSADNSKDPNKKLSPSDIAILVRTNREARLMQRVLHEYLVPSVLHSGEDLFASPEAREMEFLLSAIADHNNIRKIKTALLTGIIGLTGSEIAALDNESDENQQVIESWLTAFKKYFDLWNRDGFISMFWAFMQENRIRTKLLEHVYGERSLTNILHLAEVLHQASVNDQLSFNGILSFMRERLTSSQTAVSEQQLRLESDADRVRIVTIHKAKGLEYPIVFCPFTWEGTKLSGRKDCIFHQRFKTEKKAALILDGGSKDLDKHLLIAKQEELAENLRLLYVALTRAVHRCYFVWGPFNGSETSAPAYLLHQPSMPSSDSAEGACDKQFNIKLLRDTANRLKNLSDQEMLNDLEKLVSQSDGEIKISLLKDSPKKQLHINQVQEDILQYRQFTGHIDAEWKISSFSSLTAKKLADLTTTPIASEILPDRDADMGTVLSQLNGTENEEEGFNIFSFPHGARPGTFLHDLLEHLDFSSTDQTKTAELIREKLVQYSYDTDWQPTISKLIDNLQKVHLHHGIPGLSLSEITCSKRLNELEFYFPVSRLSPGSFKNLFGNDYNMPTAGSDTMAWQYNRLSFAPLRGFMKGFIDMIFEFDDRFFLVDWKSNYLGNRIELYHQSKLTEAMQTGSYFLQYHIYCLALHNYLENRVPGYRYDKHFGGVFYIFLRGIDWQLGPDFGIFYDKPDPTLVDKLCSLLPTGKKSSNRK
jgi:exodeoxyribonuclease V beta subunit